VSTGSVGSYRPLLPSVPGLWFHRAWDGGDGRTEFDSLGFPRVKWNSYTSYRGLSVVDKGDFQLRWWWIGDPGSAPSVTEGVDTVEPVFTTDPNIGVEWGTLPSDTLTNKALSKLIEKVKGHSFNLGVELGQLGQTVDLLAGNLRKLGRAALKLRRGDFASAARELGARPRTSKLKSKDVSGRWLELQYGWAPLVSSSYDAAKAFEAISNGPRKASVVSRVRENVEYELSQSPSQFSAKAKMQVLYQLKYELVEEMGVARQLGLEDPLSVAWELLPWSFVIDWFIPIGSYLSNLNQVPALTGRLLETKTTKVPMQNIPFVWKDYEYWGPNWGIEVVGTPSARTNYVYVGRFPTTASAVLALPKFSIGGVNSTKRLLNAISLAHQRFLR
jgi:hypothetical protein